MSLSPLILALAALLVHLFSARTAATDFMPLAEVRPGMRGVGKTVFQGTRIDTFSVEVLDVVPGALGPGQDMILARLSGGPLAESGIIQGMSGSPVYIDGRLLGAVAYGWSFTKIPIGFITPIADMARLFEEDLSPNPHQGFGGYTPVELDRATSQRLKEPSATQIFRPLSASNRWRSRCGSRGLARMLPGP